VTARGYADGRSSGRLLFLVVTLSHLLRLAARINSAARSLGREPRQHAELSALINAREIRSVLGSDPKTPLR
jgi:hypothetical protein